MKVANEEISLTLSAIDCKFFVDDVLVEDLIREKMIQGAQIETRFCTKYIILVNPTKVTCIDAFGRKQKIKALYKYQDDSSIRVDRWEDVK